MEIYYTTKIEGKVGNVAGWSKAPGYPALLAVALSPNAVGIFNEEVRMGKMHDIVMIPADLQGSMHAGSATSP